MTSLNFINDSISENDYLGYLPYIEAFEYLICNHNTLMNLPVVFGIHGKWGVGKSTFMNLIKKKLDESGSFFSIELNPWEYGGRKNFVSTFLAKLYKETEKCLCNEEKKQDGIVTALFKSILKPLKFTADFKLSKVEYDFSKLNFSSQKQIVDDFISENYAMKETIKDILDAEIFERKKVIVFVDDLDRCPTEKVMEVIEAIKLILNSKNCIFFIGCDKEYLENALKVKYKEFIQFLEDEQFGKDTNNNIPMNNKSFKNFSREYLEKIIQVPFNIPKLDEYSVKSFIECILQNKVYDYSMGNYKNKNFFEEFKKDLKHKLVTALVLEAELNPRRIKRILNLIFLNYIFIKFKFRNDNNTLKDIDIDILSFLGFIRDVKPEYYRKFMSDGLICKRIFKEYYTLSQKNVKNEEEEEEYGDSKEYMKDPDINDYFRIFYGEVKLRNEQSLLDKLKNIEVYITVSNITTSENYKGKNVIPIRDIKSDITSKRVGVFLDRLKNNDIAQNFIIWFFENIYLQSEFAIGIQRNIHLYKKGKYGEFDIYNDFIFRLEYSDKEKTLFIKFEWGKFRSKLIDKLEYISLNNYDSTKNQIIINSKSTHDEVSHLKTQLNEIVCRLN